MIAISSLNIIVGIDPSLSKYRVDMWNHLKADLPELEKIPLIGAVNEKTFDTEKVISLNPDVIFIPLYMKDQYESDVKPKIDAAGIPTIYIDYHAEKLENHQRSIEAIGKALGKEERAEELKKFYTEHVTRVTDRVNKINKPKPTVYIETGNEGPEGFGTAYSSKVAWGALATVCGADLITKDVVASAGPVNPEFILEKDPDIMSRNLPPWDCERIRRSFFPECAPQWLPFCPSCPRGRGGYPPDRKTHVLISS